MPYTRRRMIKTSLALGAALCVPMPARAAQAAYGLLNASASPRRRTLSIIQGATDESRTQFSVVHPAGYAPEAIVSLPDGTAVVPAQTRPRRFPGQPMAVTQYFFSGLFPGTDFTLTIHGNAADEILDQRIFRTLDPRPRELKFALCSCMHDRHHAPEIWRSLAADQPDVILFIGDSTYTDEEVKSLAEARPETLWRRFAEARQTLDIYHQPRLIPILAVWDDHDFGNNDTNSVDYPFVQESQKNFLTFFPQDFDYCRFLDRGPGIASAFTFRGQKIVLLDDRSFRLPSGAKDRYAHWGRAQEEWAMEHVLEHGGASWLVNGSQFFPSVIWKESVWRNHPKQLEGLMQRLRNFDRKVLFASGDVHYSEISRLEPALLGYESFEVTSSSIHSKSVPGFPTLVPNPRRILSTGERNYVLVKAYADAEPRKRDFKVESKGADGRPLFRHDITL